MTDPKLPPLPPHAFSRNSGTFAPLYTADQMNSHWLDGYRAGQSSVGPMTREDAYQLLSRHIHPTNMFFTEAMIAAVIEAPRRGPAVDHREMPMSKPSALQKYRDAMPLADHTLSPWERLKFFCSLAMNGQDWLDAEQFFSAVADQQAVPEGWWMVPVEPTPAMLTHICPASAALREWEANYRAMLAAAPTPPAGEQSADVIDALRYRTLRDASVTERRRFDHYASEALDLVLDVVIATSPKGVQEE